MKTKIVLTLTLLFCLTFGQANLFAKANPKKFDAIVHTTKGARLKGIFEKADDKGVTLMIRNKPQFFAASEISSIKIQHRNSLNKHMGWFSLAGLAGTGTAYKIESDNNKIDAYILPAVVVGGIVYGAGFGALVNAFRPAVGKFTNVNTTYPQVQKSLATYTSETFYSSIK